MSRTTQIFCASTPHGAVTLAAAAESGCLARAERRVLLVLNAATIPEATPSLDGMPGFAALRDRFDELLSWNEVISPLHPASWTPRPDDIPLLERHLRLLWGLGDDRVELVVESLQDGPALTVTRLFTGAPVHACAEGLTGYGPTPDRLDPLVGTRVRQLLHLDLVPGLRPMLLSEFDVPARAVPASAFLKVVKELSGAAGEVPAPPDGAALLLDPCPSAPGLLSPEEEEELRMRMLRGAVARGHRTVVLAPHPTAPVPCGRALEAEAGRLGADLVVPDPPVLAEVLFERARPALVVGCCSTALFTASVFYGLPVARTGTGELLGRLRPHQEGNRVPAVLSDAVLPSLEAGEEGAALDADALNDLVTALGFTLRPRLHPSLRPAAERYLAQHSGPHVQRYFPRGRLTSLGLPGGVPKQLASLSRHPAARRMARRARALRKAVRG